MDKPISVGDLVVVVKPCGHCGDAKDLGLIYRVAYIWESGAPTDCCRDRTKEVCAYPAEGLGHALPTLKRIPPLGELEGQPTQEDMKEPA